MVLCHMNPFYRCKSEAGSQCAPQKAISGIQCPEVADYSSTGETFLLRCGSQEEAINKTNCDDFAEVTCGKAITLQSRFEIPL